MYKRAPLERRLRRRGRIWSFWGYDYAGQRYTASTHQTDRQAAIEAARKIEREKSVPQTDRAKEPQSCTLIAALEELDAFDIRACSAEATVKFHRDRGRHLVRLFGATYVFDGNAPRELRALQEYTDRRLGEGASRHTVQKEHRVLRQALGLMHARGQYSGEPRRLALEGFRRARSYYRPGTRWLECAEWIEALLHQVQRSRLDDVLALVNLGVRRRELCAIRELDVDWRALTVHVRGTKTEHADRVLPLNAASAAALGRRASGVAPGVPLFRDWGSGNRDLRMAWERARRALLAPLSGRARAELDARLPDRLTFNDLRRTFCSLCRNAGVSFEDCAELLGHRDVVMVRTVYGHTSLATKRAAVARLPALFVSETDATSGRGSRKLAK